jgi:LysM domain-containing protein
MGCYFEVWRPMYSKVRIMLPIIFILAVGAPGAAVPGAVVRSTVSHSAAPESWIHPDAVTVVAVQIPRTYVIAPGDTLAGIATKVYGKPDDWPALWYKNRGKIPDPDVIRAGMKLLLGSDKVTNTIYKAAMSAIPVPPAPVRAVTLSAPSQPVPSQPSDPISTGGMGAFEQCVIAHESGGDAYIWNASGHWGLFQFSASTWASAGGDPSLFGNAGPAYQEQVFAWAYAKWGTSPWAPYDGC